jgi:fatty acid-binding protein DegV
MKSHGTHANNELPLCVLSIVRDVLVQNGSTLKFILKRIEKEKDRICTILALDILSKCVIGLNYCQKALTELLQVCPSHT